MWHHHWDEDIGNNMMRDTDNIKEPRELPGWQPAKTNTIGIALIKSIRNQLPITKMRLEMCSSSETTYKTELRTANMWISTLWSLEQKNPSPPRLNNFLISAMGWQNVSVCLCVHMKMYTKGCAGVCALDMEARGLLWVSYLRSCPPYFLRQVISLGQKTHQLGQVCLPEKPGVCLTLSLWCWVCKSTLTSLASKGWKHEFWKLTSSSQACTHKTNPYWLNCLPSPNLNREL